MAGPRTAPLTLADAWSVARRTCAPACVGYHAPWRLFRLAGLKSNPAWHTGFYRQALRSGAPAGVRVLVCGSCDETMPRILTELMPGAAVTVADVCSTPLTLIDAWAAWT